MIRPLGNNVLLERDDNTSNNEKIIIMPKQDNNIYLVIGQGEQVQIPLVNKKVFVIDGLKNIEYQNRDYLLVNAEKILAVVEEA